MLNEKNQAILVGFADARKSFLFKRTFALWKLGIHRQTFWDNMALILAAILKKI